MIFTYINLRGTTNDGIAMYVCHCNPFTDHSVRDCLDKTPGKASVSKVYKACSGGNGPNCGTCLPTLIGMIREHNANVEIRALEKNLPAPEKAAAQKR
jgi:bacterioferritin-associated ferredoxin